MFLLTALALTAEGFLLAELVLGKRERVLAALLGYPLGALVNALLFFALNLVGVAVNGVGVWVGHLVVLIGLIVSSFFLSARQKERSKEKTLRRQSLLRAALCLGAVSSKDSDTAPRRSSSTSCRVTGAGLTTWLPQHPPWRRNLAFILASVCTVLLFIIAISSIAYTTLLPSYYWDAFTNWAARAKVSFFAGTFVTEGVAQPQYPILPHALSMVYMVYGGWNDWLVGPSTLLLSLSGFAALFVLLKRYHGTLVALVTLTLALSMPLAVIHLRQGFFDIHLAAYVLLSALLLQEGLHNAHERLIILSAILCSAAAWTKWEGVYFGVMPWAVIVIARTNVVYSFIRLFVYSGSRERLFQVNESTNSTSSPLRSSSFEGQAGQANQRINGFNTIPACLLLALLVLPWPLYVLSQGLPLSPHGGSFAFNISALPLAFRHMFLMGTFGLHWYAIGLFVFVLAMMKARMLLQPPILWGLIATVLILLVYLFTKETRGLEHGDNFSRALLMPTMMLTVGLLMAVARWIRD